MAPIKPKNSFGTLEPPSSESEESNVGRHTSLSSESEDESGEYLIYLTQPGNDFLYECRIFLELQHNVRMQAKPLPFSGRKDDVGTQEHVPPPPEPEGVKRDFCLRELVSPSPELEGVKRDFCLRELVSPSPEPEGVKRDFCLREPVSPSSEPEGVKCDFGLQEPLSPSPSPEGVKRDFCLRAPISPSPEPEYDFGTEEHTPPFPSPQPARNSSTRLTHTLSPVPSHISDFRVPEPFLPDLQDNIRMQMPLSPEPQGSGRPSKMSREFKIASSYVSYSSPCRLGLGQASAIFHRK